MGVGGNQTTCGAWCSGQASCAASALPAADAPCVEQLWYHTLTRWAVDPAKLCPETCVRRFREDAWVPSYTEELENEAIQAVTGGRMTLDSWKTLVRAYVEGKALRQQLSAAVAAGGFAEPQRLLALRAAEVPIDAAVANASSQLAAGGQQVSGLRGWPLIAVGAVAIVATAGVTAYVAGTAIEQLNQYLVGVRALGVCEQQAATMPDAAQRAAFLVRCVEAAKPEGSNWATWVLVGGSMAAALGLGVFFYRKYGRK